MDQKRCLNLTRVPTPNFIIRVCWLNPFSSYITQLYHINTSKNHIHTHTHSHSHHNKFMEPLDPSLQSICQFMEAFCVVNNTFLIFILSIVCDMLPLITSFWLLFVCFTFPKCFHTLEHTKPPCKTSFSLSPWCTHG